MMRSRRAAAALAVAALAGGGAAAAVALDGPGAPAGPRTAVLAGPRPSAHDRAGAVVHDGPPGTESVPILMYHVIQPAPPGAPFPGLYVVASDFAAQMHALAGAGYHA